MGGFRGRLTLADTLEKTFIESFNEACEEYQIIKYGIESTLLAEAHSHIRFCYDDTSKFIRYIPDSVLVNVNNPRSEKTTLIEFKAANTGVRQESFLATLRRACPDMEPPFGSKEDIFNIEMEALELYRRLDSIGVKTIVITFANFREEDSKLLCQFVDNIAICNSYNPNTRGQNVGSGTWISNVNLASFINVPEFFETHFEIDVDVLEAVKTSVYAAFGA